MENTKKYILAICKDPGDANGVIPVARRLWRKRKVVLIASGKAETILRNRKIKYKKYAFADRVLKDYPRPLALVTGMSSKGGVGRDLIPLMRKKFGTSCPPIVALQDFWGSYLATDWKNERYRPDYIVVNDKIGAEVVTRVWKDFDKNRVKIFGYPNLDRFYGLNMKRIRQTARKKLNLTQKWPVVFFGGQLKYSVHALEELIAVLNRIGRPVYLIVRQHLRMKDDDAEELKDWKKALKKFKNGKLILTPQFIDSGLLIAVADVAVSMFSAVLVEAAALQKACVAISYKNYGLKRLKEITKGALLNFPLVAFKACAQASNRKQLESLVKEALSGRLEKKLKTGQKRHLKSDGKNAQRVADFVLSLI